MELKGESISLSQLAAVAHNGEAVKISAFAQPRILESRKVVEEIIARDAVVYGVTTGFGKLSDVRIPRDALNELQLNLVRSHACGIGEPLSEPEVRAMMLLRANVLTLGFSGIRLEIIQMLGEMLNRRVHPVVPGKGSVGASGDLAPLAHLALTIIGEGEAFLDGERMESSEALHRAKLRPATLGAKEGLALLNGTQAMHAVGGLALLRAKRLPRVQDAYSLRCMPQVHGAVRGALSHCEDVLLVESASATDNPLVFSESGDVISGGNFHGAPLAFAFDYAAIAIVDLMNMSERRIDRLVNPDKNEGLPAFLARQPGVQSGFMTAHVAAASLVNEARVLAHPASVDNITTSGGKEDHVSMGMTSALKLRAIVDLAENLLAIELLAAAEGLEHRRPLKSGTGVERAFAIVRKLAQPLTQDRSLANDIARVAEAIRGGDFDDGNDKL